MRWTFHVLFWVSGFEGDQIKCLAGIYMRDLLDAVPVDKYFELFQPSRCLATVVVFLRSVGSPMTFLLTLNHYTRLQARG